MILEVPVDGAPAPETTWWRDDAEVKSDELIKVGYSLSFSFLNIHHKFFKVMHSSGLAKIMFIPAKRTLRGKYVLKAKNQGSNSTLG